VLSLIFPPTSFPWLFAYELRVLWRGSILVRTRKYVLVPVAVVALMFQGIALILAWQIIKYPLPLPELVLVANLNLFFFFILMLSRAMTAAIDVLYSRGDVDFLLASPIPPGRVLAVRMIGVAASVAAPWALLGGALANALVVFRQFWALAIYPMLFGEGLVAAALAFALVVVLVGWVGPAAARRAGHTLALVMGVFIFALGQAPRYIAPDRLAHFWQGLMPAGGARGLDCLFGRGLLGQLGPLAASLAFAVAVFALVWATLDGRFAAGAISASAYRPAGAARRQGGEFRAGPGAAVFMKNLRLLTRFPGVVSQTVYRSLTLVPVVMILGGRLRVGGGVEVVAPLLVFLTGQLALFFISVMTGSDESPELAASAPVDAAFLRRAALGAAGYATAVLMALPVMAVLLRDGALLPALLACMAGVLASNLALGFRMPIPLIRAEFGKSQNGTLLGLMLGVGVSSVWALAVWLVVAPHPFAWLLAR
jgi:ABC-2 type transport system permease protein